MDKCSADLREEYEKISNELAAEIRREVKERTYSRTIDNLLARKEEIRRKMKDHG